MGESDAGEIAALTDWELSPIRVPILTRIAAIDTELTCRGIRMCGCGLATDNAAMMDGHLFQYPAHEERDLGRYLTGR